MPPTGRDPTPEELRDEFKSAVEEVVEESDLATRQDVYDEIAKQTEDEEEPPEAPEELPDEAGEPDSLIEQLEEEGVPDDLIEAIKEYLDSDAVAKSLGVRHTDSYLASTLEDGAEVLAEKRKEAQERQDAIAEEVAANAEESDVLDATVYANEDF
ncbi:hypothetical protein [Halobaculum magnesiiphilum]|uniref:Uncharacterized protein n=1 Tax=Halobaculum magnesiiphilum TaxID=1017351 RepID=A0A8T8WFC8_9EURY|nr:hypothetical protein [Halobaculum magnesiiphilum]QZP38541.1 hypothetical protein K6T50_05210 [Halobaculum magnesiiphilum]